MLERMTFNDNYNYKHANRYCPICKSNETLHDEHHGEIFCSNCGFVLQRNITQYQVVKHNEEPEKRKQKWSHNDFFFW